MMCDKRNEKRPKLQALYTTQVFCELNQVSTGWPVSNRLLRHLHWHQSSKAFRTDEKFIGRF